MTIGLDKDNFEEAINSHGPVLIDFYADWCEPCKSLMPIMEELAEKYKVCKCNIMEYGYITRKYQIMSVPTVLIFKDGQVVERLIGVKTLFEYENALRG